MAVVAVVALTGSCLTPSVGASFSLPQAGGLMLPPLDSWQKGGPSA